MNARFIKGDLILGLFPTDIRVLDEGEGCQTRKKIFDRNNCRSAEGQGISNIEVRRQGLDTGVSACVSCILDLTVSLPNGSSDLPATIGPDSIQSLEIDRPRIDEFLGEAGVIIVRFAGVET